MKILFLIPNLSHGGAEKVLVNLVNNMDRLKYDITVKTLFDIGVNKFYLLDHIKYEYVYNKQFKGNSHYFKLFSPQRFYKKIVKSKYDVVVSYLEGPTSRIVSGCDNEDTKLVCWNHGEMDGVKTASAAFRSIDEARDCYSKFHKIVCVSKTVEENFKEIFNIYDNTCVLYNTNETEEIKKLSTESVDNTAFSYKNTGEAGGKARTIKICSTGKIIDIKAFDRLVRIHKRLTDDKIKTHFYILGVGDKKNELEKYLKDNNLSDTFTFLGFHKNPYKYMANCDLYVCSSKREGFSTAVTEAIIIGLPVVTTNCSGMEEILGDNEFGIITENDENALYEGIKKMITEEGLLDYYKRQAAKRSDYFSKEKTVAACEEMFDNLVKEG